MIETYTLPIVVVSTPNRREHWSVKAKRAKAHREAAIMIPKRKWDSTYRVTITRWGPRKLDSDNLIAGCKALRDGIADRLGLDDADERIVWEYTQERHAERQVTVRIESWPVH